MKKLSFLLVVFMLGFGISSMAYAGEGHEAGREWAEEHSITDTSYDNGNSDSFNEGVREYAEEQQQSQGE